MKLQTRALGIVRKFFPNVTSVTDATKPVAIEVTKRDTASEGRKSHKTCAMAVACKRKFHADGALISMARAYIIRGARAVRYEIPGSAKREIVSFDRGGRFAPGEYVLGRVQQSHIQRPKKGHGGKHTGTRPRPYHVTEGIRTTLV